MLAYTYRYTHVHDCQNVAIMRIHQRTSLEAAKCRLHKAGSDTTASKLLENVSGILWWLGGGG